MQLCYGAKNPNKNGINIAFFFRFLYISAAVVQISHPSAFAVFCPLFVDTLKAELTPVFACSAFLQAKPFSAERAKGNPSKTGGSDAGEINVIPKIFVNYRFFL